MECAVVHMGFFVERRTGWGSPVEGDGEMQPGEVFISKAAIAERH
jgi:hypothetical protein